MHSLLVTAHLQTHGLVSRSIPRTSTPFNVAKGRHETSDLPPAYALCASFLTFDLGHSTGLAGIRVPGPELCGDRGRDSWTHVLGCVYYLIHSRWLVAVSNALFHEAQLGKLLKTFSLLNALLVSWVKTQVEVGVNVSPELRIYPLLR